MVAQDQRCIQYSGMAKRTAGRPLGPTPQVTPFSWMDGWLDTFVAWSRMFTVLVGGLGHEMYCGKRRSNVCMRTGLVGSPAHSSHSQARHWLLPDTHAAATSESADISRTVSVSEYPNFKFPLFRRVRIPAKHLSKSSRPFACTLETAREAGFPWILYWFRPQFVSVFQFLIKWDSKRHLHEARHGRISERTMFRTEVVKMKRLMSNGVFPWSVRFSR